MIFFNGIPSGRIRFASISLPEIIKLALQFIAADIIRNLCPPVRPSINIPNRRLAVLTGISTGPLTGRLDERIDRW